ncbi:DUF4124 domain-containing protein [Pseudomonas aeruginosa]|uniref:DUF4124 domain-containing protein n=1 Tax=Pseudomonas aeruginosa TaxID=287 RepID=UPI0021F16B2C|nr:DUF4124 domain-containing protein [Pseudomonas aeruginosa]UYM58716.1 DUF4124 domain-containing protein [Pseudomonas aeruginosa]
MQHLRGFYRATASLAVLALLSFPSASAAQVYRCVDAAGKVTFSDQGCAGGHSSSAIDVAPANTLDSSQYRSPLPQPEVPYRVAPSARSGVQVNVVGGDNDAERERKKALQRGLDALSRISWRADLCSACRRRAVVRGCFSSYACYTRAGRWQCKASTDGTWSTRRPYQL